VSKIILLLDDDPISRIRIEGLILACGGQSISVSTCKEAIGALDAVLYKGLVISYARHCSSDIDTLLVMAKKKQPPVRTLLIQGPPPFLWRPADYVLPPPFPSPELALCLHKLIRESAD
jgi:hypothetical protein